jgi:hypothetical protein
METKKELLVSRMYQKDTNFLALYVRELSGGEIDGTVFQLEVYKDNVEDTAERQTSGDIYFIRSKYFGKLANLFEDGWKKTNAGVHSASQNRDLFNPEVL